MFGELYMYVGGLMLGRRRRCQTQSAWRRYSTLVPFQHARNMHIGYGAGTTRYGGQGARERDSPKVRPSGKRLIRSESAGAAPPSAVCV